MNDTANKITNKIIESAIRDPGGPGMQKRHERRIRAMKALGDAERRFENILTFGVVAIFAIPVLFMMALVGAASLLAFSVIVGGAVVALAVCILCRWLKNERPD